MPSERSVSVHLRKDVHSELKRRAKRELMSIHELAGDILRRSAIHSKAHKKTPKGPKSEKFITYFSRYPSGRKRAKLKPKIKSKKAK